LVFSRVVSYVFWESQTPITSPDKSSTDSDGSTAGLEIFQYEIFD